jgi:hypothetical protein
VKNKARKIILNILNVITVIMIAVLIESYVENNITDRNKNNKSVMGEESQNDGKAKSYSSEDYKINQFVIIGEGGTETSSENENTILEILNVRSEVYSLKGKDETKALVVWKTNKSSISEIAYKKRGENIEKIIKENEYNLSHSQIIENLDADSIYSFKIRNIDKWGNEKVSDEYVTYTGAPNVSFIDVLENATTKLFGWAMKNKQ